MLKIFLSILFIETALANDLDQLKDVITDPAISRRCKALINERNEKIQYIQKLNFLLLRNEKLKEKTKVNEVNLRNKLDLNQVQIKNNQRLSNMRLKSMEENIVRKGCPGLTI